MPVLDLFMVGQVRADVWSTPDRLFFGRMAAGQRRELTLDVVTARGVSVEKIRGVSRELGLRIERLPSPRFGIRVHATLRAPSEPGAFEEELILTTTSERQAILRIPVLAWVE